MLERWYPGRSVPEVERAGLGLDAVVGGTDVPNAKPAPDVLLAAAQRLGVEPADGVRVGDTEIDRAAARAAGVRFVGRGIAGDHALGKAGTLGARRELLELPGLLRHPFDERRA